MQLRDVKKIFFFSTFKLCDNNGYMSTQIYNFFLENGFQMLNKPDDADCIIISTCGFDQERENQSASLVNDYMAVYGSGKQVIICGCLTKINPDLFDTKKILLIGPKELYKFNELFQPEQAIENITAGRLNDRFISKGYGVLNAYYLQICQGCVNNCSYCAIKKAKGGVKSKPVDIIVNEIEYAIDNGFEQVMLLADDCGSYGQDIGTDLAELLNRIAQYDIRILINYIEPLEFQILYPKIEKAVFNQIDFMNIPVQSTSKRIIRLMNRNYDTDDVMHIVRRIKENFPHIYIETHVIYCFPGETYEEFIDNFRLASCFDAVIFFYYSDRKNVPSSFLKGKLACSDVRSRTEEILNHPLFTFDEEEATPPVLLLGYHMKKTEDIFKSIDKSYLIAQSL